jgi:transposase
VSGIFAPLQRAPFYCGTFICMAKIYHIDLTEEERTRLESIVSKRLSTCEASKRANILLSADRLGQSPLKDSEISQVHQVSIRTIERLRERFVNEGLEVALRGKPRLNLDKIKFDGKVDSNLIALRCSDPPSGRSSWTLRLLADKMVELSYVDTISYESVRGILKKTKLSLGRS